MKKAAPGRGAAFPVPGSTAGYGVETTSSCVEPFAPFFQR